ncbi:MAG: winged helix-turn-helix transcriptional regulator [Dehalococcoidia bacterium]
MTSPSTTDEELADETSDLAAEDNASGLRPVERALELIGARWTLILIRHLLAGPHGFQELRDRTGITPRLLSVRLTEMIEQGFVKKVPYGNRARYALTDFGKTLEPIVRELALWWLRHAMPRFGPHQGANPSTVFEAISYLLRRDQLNDADTSYDLRLTVREDGGWTVDFTDAPKQKDDSRQTLLAGAPDQISEDRTVREIDAVQQPAVVPATAGDTRGGIVWHPMPYGRNRG